MSAGANFEPGVVMADPSALRPTIERGRSGADGPRALWQLTPRAAAQLEATMQDVLAEIAGELHATATRAVSRGGKRLRPALALAVATSRSPRADAFGAGAMCAASAVELMHRATLVHDDLLDGSSRRHGAVTINAGEGTARALLTGDMLIAAAHVLAAQAGPAQALLMARTLADMCRGEALQLLQEFSPDVTATAVLTVARLKSGSLLRAAAVLGGHAAGHNAETLDALARYGDEFGMALQLVDDLLDVLADAETVGKPVGADFADGTVTLPAIVAMQRHPELRDLLHPGLDETSRQRAGRLLRCRHAVRATRDAAYDHADRAAMALRRAVRQEPGLADIARWPRQYVRHQFRTALTEPITPITREHRED